MQKKKNENDYLYPIGTCAKKNEKKIICIYRSIGKKEK